MLEDIGIHNVGALASRTEAELRAHKGFTKKDVYQINSYLRRLGLSLGMKFDESLWTNST
jgi:DNA-directed RNA polymerase alpha subunit